MPSGPLRCFTTVLRSSALAGLVTLLLPVGGWAQLVFDWPIRDTPVPEAVLTGAAAIFWNPGSLTARMGTRQEVWVAHVDGPDVSGIGGVAAAAVLDLPLGIRAGLGYWHLGISDIPRTVDSPLPAPGSLRVTEDAAVLTLSRGMAAPAGAGGSLRFLRGEAGGVSRTRLVGDVGVHIRSDLPLAPRFGLTVRNIGANPDLLAGTEVFLPPLARGRLPLWAGYGMEIRGRTRTVEQRFSLRGSWRGLLHAGTGLTRWGRGDDWTALLMIGADLGRYSLSVLREGLANGFGAVHYFRAAVGFW
jgi:hypothetical protein